MAVEIEKLIQELTQTLEVDFLQECVKEPEIPFTAVKIKSECIVELPSEVIHRLTPKIDLG